MMHLEHDDDVESEHKSSSCSSDLNVAKNL